MILAICFSGAQKKSNRFSFVEQLNRLHTISKIWILWNGEKLNIYSLWLNLHYDPSGLKITGSTKYQWAKPAFVLEDAWYGTLSPGLWIKSACIASFNAFTWSLSKSTLSIFLFLVSGMFSSISYCPSIKKKKSYCPKYINIVKPQNKKLF